MKRLVSLLAVLALTVTAQAAYVDITGGGGDTLRIHIDFMGTETFGLGGPMDTYKISAEALNPAGAGDYVKAADVMLTGSLSQVGDATWNPPVVFPIPVAGSWSYTYTPDMLNVTTLNGLGLDLTPYGPFPNYELIDTHFMVNASGTAWNPVVTPVSEDNDFSFGANAYGFSEGLGTQLSVVSSLNAGVPMQTLDLIWVAIPTGTTAFLAGGGLADAGGEQFALGLPIPIPEPVSMTLLALGGLAVLRKRR